MECQNRILSMMEKIKGPLSSKIIENIFIDIFSNFSNECHKIFKFNYMF